MPALCHFYSYTPQEFYDMDFKDCVDLLRYMAEYRQAERDALKR